MTRRSRGQKRATTTAAIVSQVTQAVMSMGAALAAVRSLTA